MSPLARLLRALFPLSLLIALAAPGHAMLPELPAAPETTPAAAAPAIDAASDPASDRQIAARIKGIFGELPAFRAVGVTVNAGVVNLSGQVPKQEDIARAEVIAGRVSGVVTVENAIERDVSLAGNLTALGSLQARLGDFTKMLPLIGLALAVAFAIGLIGYLIAGLTGLWRRIAPNSFLAGLIASAIRFVFVIGGIIVALDILGATALLGAVLGGAGVIGVALGFAMRDTIENYVASLMLSLRQPFRANDHVTIDDYEGRVIRLTSRATVLMTLDGNHLRIPNGTVFKAVILNYTRNPQRRFEFDLGVDADDDPTQARHVGVSVLKELPFVLDKPEPTARVLEVGDSNIVIRFLGWIDQRQTDWFKAKSRAIPAVKDALEQAGFALPEPIYRLRFDAAMPLPVDAMTGAMTGGGSPATATATETDGGQATASNEPARPKVDVPAATAEDVSPENDVEIMVAAERAGDGDDADLLDSGKPVE